MFRLHGGADRAGQGGPPHDCTHPLETFKEPPPLLCHALGYNAFRRMGPDCRMGPHRLTGHRAPANLPNRTIGTSSSDKAAENQSRTRLYSGFMDDRMSAANDNNTCGQTTAVQERRARAEAKLTPAQQKLLDISATIFDEPPTKQKALQVPNEITVTQKHTYTDTYSHRYAITQIHMCTKRLTIKTRRGYMQAS